MSRVTYEEVLKFYLGKSSECSPLLKEYILEFGQKTKGYILVYDNFRFAKRERDGKTINEEIIAYNNANDIDDIEFNNELIKFLCGQLNIKQNKINTYKKNISNIFKLNEVAVLYKLTAVEEIEDIRFNQKWHLIISYIMYQVLYGVQQDHVIWKNISKAQLEKNFDYYSNNGVKGVKCPELMLWMIEASGVAGNLDDLNECYIDLVNEVEEMKNNNKNNLTICAEIRKEYPWEKIEEIIAPRPKQEENK